MLCSLLLRFCMGPTHHRFYDCPAVQCSYMAPVSFLRCSCMASASVLLCIGSFPLSAVGPTWFPHCFRTVLASLLSELSKARSLLDRSLCGFRVSSASNLHRACNAPPLPALNPRSLPTCCSYAARVLLRQHPRWSGLSAPTPARPQARKGPRERKHTFFEYPSLTDALSTRISNTVFNSRKRELHV